MEIAGPEISLEQQVIVEEMEENRPKPLKGM